MLHDRMEEYPVITLKNEVTQYLVLGTWLVIGLAGCANIITGVYFIGYKCTTLRIMAPPRKIPSVSKKTRF